MSAHKHKISGGRKTPISELEKYDSYMWRLSMDVSRACDGFQMRKNNYKPNGFRGIINASVLKTKSQKD